MKKIMLIACLGLMATVTFAQDNGTPVKSGVRVSKQKVKYYCPKCMSVGENGAKCPICNINRIGAGDYYCPSCLLASADKSRTCPRCGRPLVEMKGK
jgi:hypothetical protein